MSLKSNFKEPFIDRVFDFIQKNDLVLRGETLIVGVSGGPDSVCLLHVLFRLTERLDIKLHIAHLNHQLRGVESQADAKYVSQLAAQLGISVTLEQRDVEGYRVEHRLSLEEAAREVRYQFFTDVARAVGTKRIVLGHNANDQVETILMHLIRGAGVYGLQGMHPLTKLELLADTRLILVRPLLEVSREEIESYCQQNNLVPRRDSSNLSPFYLRNRIRYELIPLLQGYNPRIIEALLRTANSLALDFSYLGQQVSQIWDTVVSGNNETLVLKTGEFDSIHPALQRYLLREVVKHILGNLKDIEWKHIEKMRSALKMKEGKKVILPRGLILYMKHGECWITRTNPD